MFTEYHVIVSFVAAAIGCLFYAATRYRRRERFLWGWMFVPCLEVIAIYTFFLLGGIPVDERPQLVRMVFISIGVQIAVISIILAVQDYRNVRK